MSLSKDLSSEVLIEMATVIHTEACLAAVDDEEDLDEDETAECINEDVGIVKELLEILEREGVEKSRIFIPFRRIEGL